MHDVGTSTHQGVGAAMHGIVGVTVHDEGLTKLDVPLATRGAGNTNALLGG